MHRLLISKLEEWKNSADRKPLLLMGARQVGKTWLMKTFGETHYAKTAYISFYNNRRMRAVFEDDYDISRIILNLNIESGIAITPSDTLIIFDEIQNAPKALEALKYFCEDAPEYHVIAAGSLLGTVLHEGVSFPVGKVDMLHLYPMNYREFLYAMDETMLADALVSQDFSVIDNFSDKYLFYLKNYLYVGGMPAVVESFRTEKDYHKVRHIQENILLQYKGDFGKHIRGNEVRRINMVWESLPMQLAKENKKFFFGQIKSGARSKDFETAIQWLTECGLVYKVSMVNEPHIPLAAYKNFSSYKLFVLDVGLLSAMSETDVESILNGNEIFTEFKGALAEQYVLQQLISDTNYTPYYYSTSSSSFEQDFIIQKGRSIIPIEVKADKNVRSQSLKAFYDKFHPDLSVRFSARQYVSQGWMVNIPLYAVCRL